MAQGIGSAELRNCRSVEVDPLLIELVHEMVKTLTPVAGPMLGERMLQAVERPLTELFPFFRHLGVFRVMQIRRALEHLELRVRHIEVTRDPERLLGFPNICYRFFEAGAKEHREIKVKILASACAHCADASNAHSFDQQLEILDAVERLQPFHARLLSHLHTHHVQELPGGGHRHLPEATFQKLLDQEFGLPDPPNVWLGKALFTLQQMSAVCIPLGGMMVGPDGALHPVNDPLMNVQHGKIGLTVFGGELLTYIRAALDENENSPSSLG